MLRHRYGYFCGLLFLAAIASAQTAPVATASVTGRLISEEGRNIRAIVSLQPVSAKGYPFPTRRTFTRQDGSFTFSRLPAGAYTVCTQVPDSEAQQPSVAPFLDTCAWGSSHTPITVTAGNQATGLVLTAPKGTWLKLRVADPDGVLPKLAAVGPTPLESAIQFMLRGADNRNHHARFVSADSGGRNYQLVVPLNAALKLSLTSSAGNLFNQTGAAVKSTDTVAVQATAGIPLAPMTFTIHRVN